MYFLIAVRRNSYDIPAHTALFFIVFYLVGVFPKTGKLARLHIFRAMRWYNLCRVLLNVVAIVAIESVLPLCVYRSVPNYRRDKLERVVFFEDFFGWDNRVILEVMRRRHKIFVSMYSKHAYERHSDDGHNCADNICPVVYEFTHTA